MTIQSLFRGHYFLIFKNFFYNNETFCLIVNIMEVKMFYRPYAINQVMPFKTNERTV